MKNGALISGILVTGLGVVLIVLAIFLSWVFAIYGIPLFIIGLIVLLNKREDRIEQVKKRKGGKK